MRRIVMGLVALISISAARRAQGQAGSEQFGEAHQLVISGDRLFGYVYSSSTRSAGGMDMTTTSNNISILSSPFSSVATNYAFPRLAIDGFVIKGLSVGGAASYFWTSIKPAGAARSSSASGYSFSPRVGYAVPFSPAVAIWPRAGVTYLHASGVGTDATLYAATLEVPIAIMLGPHLAILCGPTVDFGLGGSQTTTGNVKTDAKGTDVGVQFGLAGYL